MILVTGASGTVGRLVVKLLLNRRIAVRALTRDATRIPGRDGLDVAQGDFGDVRSLKRALHGVSAVLAIVAGEQLAAQDQNLVEVAAESKVDHFVKLSVLSAGYDAEDPITQWHRQGERSVRESRIGWTILRANAFMSNALNWAETIRSHATVYAPFVSAPVSAVAPDDIAEVACACLVVPPPRGSILELTGPAALSVRQQVSVLSRVLGRDLSVVDAPAQQVRAAMTTGGMSATLADAVVAMLAQAEKPFSSKVSNDVHAMLGRRATSFELWCSANRRSFE